MASIVTSHLARNGLPLASGYTTGFAALTGGLILATIAGLLIPAVRHRDTAEAPAVLSREVVASADTVVTGE
jgi:hypothetical protein